MKLRQAAFAALCAAVVAVGISISLYSIFSSVFMGLALAAFLADRDMRGWRGAFVLLILLYVAANLVSLAATQYMPQSVRGLTKVLRHALVCLSVVSVVDTRERFRTVVQCFMAASFVICLDGLFQGITGFEPMNRRGLVPLFGEWQRITGPFRHCNDFAGYLTVAFPLLAAVAAGASGYYKRPIAVLCAVAALCALGALVWTYSRGGWVGVAVAFTMVAFFKRNRFLIGVVSVFALWAVFFSPPLVRERALSLLDTQNNTIQYRRQVLHDTMLLSQRSPVIGHGVNTYMALQFEKRDESFQFKETMYAHNGYAQMLVEIGWLGLGSFLIFIAYFFSRATPAVLRARDAFMRDAGLGLLAGLVAFLMHSGTDTNLHSLLLINLFWIAVGLVWAVRRIDADTRTGP